TTEQAEERRTKRRKVNQCTSNMAHTEQYDSKNIILHNLGYINIECTLCGALHWKDEKVSGTVKRPVFSTCCANGKVHLQPLAQTPPILHSLLTENNAHGRNFQKKIRIYNSVLAFTSMGTKVDEQVTGSSGTYSFRIHGEMYHQI
ncbi:8991_t:CDS:1, partial [Gigaspora margarita]